MESNWRPSNPRMVAQAEAARITLLQLANQVGVRCGQCGTVLHGHAAICAISFMAPWGTEDFQARPYCRDCAEALRGDG